MSKDPEELREEIEVTRSELGRDVDAIADKVSPSNIAHRQTEKVKGGIRKAKEAVMGSADSASSQTHEAMESAEESLRNAPQRVKSETRGNPLAAGLIAFGAGLLVSSLIPSSDKEGEMVQTLKEKAEPLTSELSDAAKEVADQMKDPLAQAAETVKTSASESVENIKGNASDEMGQLKDSAQGAAQDVSGDSGPSSTDRI